MDTITAGDPQITIDGAADTATVTIADDDSAQVSIAANDPNASETGPDDGQYTVTLSQASSTDTTIGYTVTGTATSGDDFSVLSGSVTIAAGNTTATIDLSTLDDAIVEASETVIVTLDSVTAGDPQITIDGAADTATVTIADDDSAQVSIAANDPNASETGPDDGQYTVTLSQASSTDTTIGYTVTGTATSGDDFSALSGSVTIAAGNTTATIDLSTLDDAIVEASETVIVTLDSVTAGDPQITIDGAADTATVTIADDDSAQVSIAANDPNASETGPDDGQYTVTLTKASSTDTTIGYTVTGTATSGDDFSALSGSVTIAAGNTTATIDLSTLDDAIVEASRDGHRHARQRHGGRPADHDRRRRRHGHRHDRRRRFGHRLDRGQRSERVGDRPRRRSVHGHAQPGQQHRHHNRLHGHRHGHLGRRFFRSFRFGHDRGR